MRPVKVKVTVTYTTEIDPDDLELDLDEGEEASRSDVIDAYKKALKYGDLDLAMEAENGEISIVEA
jgi:hypothetical protein